jgi:hypothetical protein
MPQKKHLVRQYPRAPQGLVRMLSTFNVVDATPYKRDIVKGLADACARHHMPFGVYYSTIDWHFGDPPDRRNDNPISEAHEEFNVAQLRELMTGYGPISEIWFDMGHPTKLQSKLFANARSRRWARQAPMARRQMAQVLRPLRQEMRLTQERKFRSRNARYAVHR